ncbi:MAG: type II toxin-antitoxin system RelE/ParE family toxin [Candidatus Sulfotelmatobacter sp.]
MAWTIDYTQSARNQLKKLDKPVARRILDFLDNRVAKHDDPRSLGKALTGSLGTLWRYRVGDYRIICEIQRSTVRILVVRVGHRGEVYR